MYGEVGKSERDSVEQALPNVLAVPSFALTWQSVTKHLDLFGNREGDCATGFCAFAFETLANGLSAVYRRVHASAAGKSDHSTAKRLYAIDASGRMLAELFERDYFRLVEV